MVKHEQDSILANFQPYYQVDNSIGQAAINKLKNGPAGIGGDTTALAVKIGWAATHTAICPVVINFHCWVARRFGVRFYADGHTEELFQVGE